MKKELTPEERKKLAEYFIKETESKIHKKEKETWMKHDHDNLFSKSD
jgi:hypothetical protein